ncbi:hypothetical protein ElyMa_006968400 [Elysia marginata]|uniref:Uncharacterized protein n=1 Tax=Elysia marginata TaxID=1093978 RepID=A0AAV4JJZ3_9GAST|nr:hypothetical protein ElyMa_006968400 [Elysia marginata]
MHAFKKTKRNVKEKKREKREQDVEVDVRPSQGGVASPGRGASSILQNSCHNENSNDDDEEEEDKDDDNDEEKDKDDDNDEDGRMMMIYRMVMEMYIHIYKNTSPSMVPLIRNSLGDCAVYEIVEDNGNSSEKLGRG